MQHVLEADPREELDADAIGHRAHHDGAVVRGVDVHPERPRAVRHVDDIDD